MVQALVAEPACCRKCIRQSRISRQQRPHCRTFGSNTLHTAAQRG